MILTVHRGSQQVGGTCLELSHEGSRLALDVGLPLESVEEDVRPRVSGLFADDGQQFDGIVLTHAHADHSGLLGATQRQVPIWMTKGTSQMMMAGALFARQPDVARERQRMLAPLRPHKIGTFNITAFPVDHSAYGAAALLVEAGGKRLLYTGDLRFHGRKPGMARQMVAKVSEQPLDMLVIEGTRLDDSSEPFSEAALEERLLQDVRQAPTLVLAMYSPLNVDRFVTFCRVAKRAGRILAIDPYQSFVQHLICRDVKIPAPGAVPWLKAMVPPWHTVSRWCRALKRSLWYRRLIAHGRIESAVIRSKPHRYIVLYRPNMTWLFPEGLPARTRAIFCYWNGYLSQPQLNQFKDQLIRSGGTLLHRHASGHATRNDLASLATQLRPRVLVPVHTNHPQIWEELDTATNRTADGVMITV